MLFGKTGGPMVVDTGYLGTIGCMLKWTWIGLVLLEVAGREVVVPWRFVNDLES